MDSVKAYRIIYFIYAAVGIVKLCLALFLSAACELDPKPKAAGTATETAPLLANGSQQNQTDDDRNKRRWRLLPEISKESQVVLVQLCILFACDNLASVLAPLLVYH